MMVYWIWLCISLCSQIIVSADSDVLGGALKSYAGALGNLTAVLGGQKKYGVSSWENKTADQVVELYAANDEIITDNMNKHFAEKYKYDGITDSLHNLVRTARQQHFKKQIESVTNKWKKLHGTSADTIVDLYVTKKLQNVTDEDERVFGLTYVDWDEQPESLRNEVAQKIKEKEEQEKESQKNKEKEEKRQLAHKKELEKDAKNQVTIGKWSSLGATSQDAIVDLYVTKKLNDVTDEDERVFGLTYINKYTQKPESLREAVKKKIKKAEEAQKEEKEQKELQEAKQKALEEQKKKYDTLKQVESNIAQEKKSDLRKNKNQVYTRVYMIIQELRKQGHTQEAIKNFFAQDKTVFPGNQHVLGSIYEAIVGAIDQLAKLYQGNSLVTYNKFEYVFYVDQTKLGEQIRGEFKKIINTFKGPLYAALGNDYQTAQDQNDTNALSQLVVHYLDDR